MSNNNNCPVCNSLMKPLFQSFFCPNDCDRIISSSSLMPAKNSNEFYYYTYSMIKRNVGSTLKSFVAHRSLDVVKTKLASTPHKVIFFIYKLVPLNPHKPTFDDGGFFGKGTASCAFVVEEIL